MSSILEKLASSLDRRDEVPNQELASQIVVQNDTTAVKELIEHLKNHKNKKVQNDCIKVLYEIGEQKPELISPFGADFVTVLQSKNNRLVWGAMMALDAIVNAKPDIIFNFLNEILNAADKGSVITKDHAIGILTKLTSTNEYDQIAFPLLMEQLKICPIKQLAMYAERAQGAIDQVKTKEFSELLMNRLEECEKGSQKKRIEKVIKNLQKKYG